MSCGKYSSVAVAGKDGEKLDLLIVPGYPLRSSFIMKRGKRNADRSRWVVKLICRLPVAIFSLCVRENPILSGVTILFAIEFSKRAIVIFSARVGSRTKV